MQSYTVVTLLLVRDLILRAYRRGHPPCAPLQLVAEHLVDSVLGRDKTENSMMMDDSEQWQEGDELSGAPDDEVDYSYIQQRVNHWRIHETSTTKVPPSLDGATSWFAYEEAIDDWCDITELEPPKRAPALRNRLTGTAETYNGIPRQG